MADTSFTDNPLVQAMGNALGMGGLFSPQQAQDSQQPQLVRASATTPVPPQPKPGKSNVVPQENREFRQHAPIARATPQRGFGPGQPQQGMNLPGVMSPDILLHPEVQKLLSQYGVSPEEATAAANNANPNLFVTNPEAFQKHPLMAGLLEHGLEGLAFTKPGATIGENLSNIAMAPLNASAARAEKFNNMLTMPFAEAQTVANLKNTQLDQFYKNAQAQRDNALAKHYADMDDWHSDANAIRQNQIDMQSEFHKYGADQAVLKELDKHPLDDEGSAALKELIDAHGGHVSDVPSDAINKLVSGAYQRQQDTLEKNKERRAAIGANKVTHSESSTDKTDPALTAFYESNFKAADADLAKFDNDLRGGVATDDAGGYLTPGSPELAKYRDKLKTARDAAWQKWQDGLKLSQPGSGMTIKKSKTVSNSKEVYPTLNLHTGIIK